LNRTLKATKSTYYVRGVGPAADQDLSKDYRKNTVSDKTAGIKKKA